MTEAGRHDADPAREARRHAAHITAVPRDRALPLSFAQHRLWFLDRLEPGGFSYNVPLFTRFHGPLRIDLLERSLREIVRRHEVLRTRFVETGGRPYQVIAPPSEAALALALAVDEAEPGADPSRAIDAWALREARRPFALGDGPLVRAGLLRLGPDDHVFVLAMHHAVCDDWSIDLLARELRRIYQALLRGEPPALPPVALHYADFAEWQRQGLHGESAAGQLAYWTEQLAGAPGLLALPTDRPRPAVQTTRGAMVRTAIAPDLAAATRALSHDVGVTLFMTLLAGLCALLYRYTGQSDLVVGSPIAGRTRRELEDMLGLFANTVALRVRIPDGASFRALLAGVRETCRGAYAHQDVPFEQVVEAVAPVRDASHSPLFQVMFVLQNAPPTVFELPGVVATALPIHAGMAKFDLTVFAYELDGGLQTGWEYNTDLFDRATVERMADHHARLLGELVRDPDQPLATASLLSPAERARLLELGRGARTEYPRDRSLHELFEAQVARRPDATALVFGDARLSYAALDARANRLARCLASRGVTRGDRVGVCLGRSVDFVVSILAALELGACYVPLDPGHPAERLAYMAADAGVRVIVARAAGPGGAEPAAPPELPGVAAALVWLDAIEPELARLSDARLPVVATARDLAYVMYTSGSTGRPKGVCIEQRSVASLALGADYFRLGDGDVVGHTSSTSFDAVTFEIWGALLAGATVHGFAPDVVLSPELLARELGASGCTAVFVTTALFHQLAAIAPSAFRTVDRVLIGGEAADAGAVRRVLAAGAPRRLVNGYGPTETTTFATWHAMREVGERAATMPIGRPLANAAIRILDRHGELVPIGVRGEIHIGGDGVARGYWNRPELTAERFVADRCEPGGRLYRTGDLGAWRGDGTIEFHGRLDHQVKLRGFRIELGEIEAVLLGDPAVAEAVAVVRDEAGDRRLVAYAVARAGAALDVDAVRRRLAEALPRYMVPGAIVVLERLPLTPNGKIDRGALPAPSGRRADLGGGYQAPEGELEHAVARIWAEVLGVDRVGAGDNFFDLGGNSFLLASVRARIEAEFGRSLPMVVLLQFAQVRSLSAYLAGASAATGEPERPGTQRSDGVRRLAGQRRGRTSHG